MKLPKLFAPLCIFCFCAVANLGSQDQLGVCIAGLKSSSPFQRVSAAECLGRLGTVAAPAILDVVELLGRTPPGDFFWDGVGPDGKLTGGSLSERQTYLNALVRIGEPAIQPPIDVLVSHRAPLVREAAATALGLFDDQRTIEPLVRALADPTIVPGVPQNNRLLGKEGPQRVNDSAAQALISSRTKGVGDALAHHLKDPSPAVRGGVIAILVERRDPRVIPSLEGLTKDSRWRTRADAVEKLAGFASPRIVDILLNDCLESAAQGFECFHQIAQSPWRNSACRGGGRDQQIRSRL